MCSSLFMAFQVLIVHNDEWFLGTNVAAVCTAFRAFVQTRIRNRLLKSVRMSSVFVDGACSSAWLDLECHRMGYVRPAGMPTGICQVSVGLEHVVFTTMDGTAFAFGNSQHGCLGFKGYGKRQHTPRAIVVPTWAGKAAKIVAGRDHSVLLTDRGHLREIFLGSGREGNYCLADIHTHFARLPPHDTLNLLKEHHLPLRTNTPHTSLATKPSPKDTCLRLVVGEEGGLGSGFQQRLSTNPRRCTCPGPLWILRLVP
jgi:hypothetical protein